MINMKKISSILLTAIIFMIVIPITGCSHETKVEEKVNLNPDQSTSAVVAPDKDVNVDVHVNSNPQPQPHDVVVEHDTKVINVEPPKQTVINVQQPVNPAPDDKKIEVHTNIVNQVPSAIPDKTVTRKEVSVNNNGSDSTTVTETTSATGNNSSY